jgi:MFS family permease
MSTSGPQWSALGIIGSAALIASGTFVSIGLFSMGVALPRLAASFADAPNAELLVQLIGAVVAPVFALASPLAGKLVSRFGPRPVYMISVVLIALGGAGAALCDNLTLILALRLVLAVGVAGGFTAGMSGVGRLPEARRPAVLGLISFVGGGICIPLFPLIGELAEHSWRLAFLIHLILLVTLPLALALPRHQTGAEEAAGHHGASAGRGASLVAGLPVALLVATAFAGLAMFASSMYSPFMLSSIGITEAGKVGQILGAMSLCSLAGAGSYGFIQSRLGTPAMLRIGTGAMALGCVLIGLADSLPLAISGMGVLGAGLAVFTAAGYATAIDSVDLAANVPAAMGVMTFFLYGSQMLFPVFSGTLGESAGPGSVFVLVATLMALGLVLLLSLSSATTQRALA